MTEVPGIARMRPGVSRLISTAYCGTHSRRWPADIGVNLVAGRSEDAEPGAGQFDDLVNCKAARGQELV